MFVQGGLTFLKLTKLHWFIVSHISIWDLGALFRKAISPPKLPCDDGTAALDSLSWMQRGGWKAR